jgi:hypothetical protein
MTMYYSETDGPEPTVSIQVRVLNIPLLMNH